MSKDYDEDIAFIHDILYGLYGELKAIERAIGLIAERYSLENQLCDLSQEPGAVDDLVLEDPHLLSEQERGRRLHLAATGWDDAFLRILGRESRHQRFPHDHDGAPGK